MPRPALLPFHGCGPMAKPPQPIPWIALRKAPELVARHLDCAEEYAQLRIARAWADGVMARGVDRDGRQVSLPAAICKRLLEINWTTGAARFGQWPMPFTIFEIEIDPEGLAAAGLLPAKTAPRRKAPEKLELAVEALKEWHPPHGVPPKGRSNDALADRFNATAEAIAEGIEIGRDTMRLARNLNKKAAAKK
jgi:hypothetical protein